MGKQTSTVSVGVSGVSVIGMFIQHQTLQQEAWKWCEWQIARAYKDHYRIIDKVQTLDNKYDQFRLYFVQ